MTEGEDSLRERAAVLVVNTRSRRGAQLFDEARELLTRRGFLLAASYPVRDPERIRDVVATALNEGIRLLFLGSGDGTLSSVVGLLAYHDVVLGILPLGTANRFAETLRIPMSLTEAADVIAQERVARVDLGVVNERYFANASTIGLTTGVARTISREIKRRLGWLAYVVVGTRYIFTFDPFVCRIHAAEKEVEMQTRHLIVLNGRSYGGLPVAPEAAADEGLLHVVTMGEYSRWQLAKTWLAFLVGLHMHLPEANFFATRALTVETEPPQYVDLDGEVAFRTPAQFRVAPRALQVLVPGGFGQK